MNFDTNSIIKTITANYLKDHHSCGLKEYFKNKHNDLYNYIFDFTCKLLDPSKYPFSHLLYWTVNSITEFPMCHGCGKPNTRVIKFSTGYSGNFRFCCHKCSVSNESCIAARKCTNIARYGTKTPAENNDILKKMKDTNRNRYGSDCYFSSDIGKSNIARIMNEKYGVDHNSQLSLVKDKLKDNWSERSTSQIKTIVSKSKKTKAVRYGDENYNNRSKALNTNIERYGVSNPQVLTEFQAKSMVSNRRNRNTDYPTQCPDVIDKSRRTRNEKYDSWHPVDFVEKVISTNKQLYGVDFFSQSDEWIDKTKNTNLKKYNSEWVTCKDSNIRDNIDECQRSKFNGNFYTQTQDYIDQMIDYNRSMYGVDWSLQSDSIKNKSKDTLLSKYDVDNISKSEQFKSIIRIKRLNRTYDRLLCNQSVRPLFSREEFIKNPFKSDFTWKCLYCGDVFTSCRSSSLKCEDSLYARCKRCNLSHQSASEKEIFELVYSIDKSSYTLCRDVISPKELDIYIPSRKLAIEFDGLYWRNNSMLANNKKYHLLKTQLCEEKDIQLIHIFEDEYVYKKDIVVSRLKNLLGVYDKIVYARQCIIKSVNDSDARDFLNQNHIQGFCVSSYRFGLYHNGELISLMTFGSYRNALGRHSVDNEYELLRFCNKLGYHIPGAASRLFTHCIRTITPTKIISYADRRWSIGKLYYALGFKLSHISDPNYWYIIGNHREHRFAWRKTILKDKLDIYDNDKSEYDNMLLNGYDCIFDCGNLVFEWINEDPKK